MPINIHGKEYITVAERLDMAQKDILEISTEVLYQNPVVIKATVLLKDGKKTTGISAANPSKMIEKTSPYEVAETSAVGRALGFAGYGIVNGIASADEMRKAETDPTDEWTDNDALANTAIVGDEKPPLGNCPKCGAPNALSKTNKIYCSAKCWLK